MFSLNIPNILRIITIKCVKRLRNAFTLGIFHSFVFLKRYRALFAFLYPFVGTHPFNVGIVVFPFHHELVQGFRYNQRIGITAVESTVPPALKPCNKQKKLNHFQRLVVCIDVAGEVVDLLLAESVIRHTEKDEHSL